MSQWNAVVRALLCGMGVCLWTIGCQPGNRAQTTRNTPAVDSSTAEPGDPNGPEDPNAGRPIPGPSEKSEPVEPLTVACRSRTLSMLVLQDGKPVRPTSGAYHLKPRPFTLRFAGDLDDGGYVALPDPNQMAELQKPGLVLITSSGYGAAWGGEHLCVTPKERLKVNTDTAEWLDNWADSRQEHRRLTESLELHVGPRPAFAEFGIFYLRFDTSMTPEGQTPTDDLVVRRHFEKPLGTFRRLRFLLIVTQPLTEKHLSQLNFTPCDLVFDR